MNLEALLASARPFLFHEDAADAVLAENPSTTPPSRPTPPPEPARPQRPPSRWFLTPHALLRRNPWGRYALLGVFHRFHDAATYATTHYSYGTRPTIQDIHRSSAAWTDDLHNTYIICPHPNQHTPLRINPDFEISKPGTGQYHLRYADALTRLRTSVQFPTASAAYACLATSRDLSKAIKTKFEPEKSRWEWIFRNRVRCVIQRRKILEYQNALRS